jgi:hypothetical protein
MPLKTNICLWAPQRPHPYNPFLSLHPLYHSELTKGAAVGALSGRGAAPPCSGCRPRRPDAPPPPWPPPTPRPRGLPPPPLPLDHGVRSPRALSPPGAKGAHRRRCTRQVPHRGGPCRGLLRALPPLSTNLSSPSLPPLPSPSSVRPRLCTTRLPPP